MRESLADAELAPDDIDYINAHASSTQLNDSTETMAIQEVFGAHAARCRLAGRRLSPRIRSARPARSRRRSARSPSIASWIPPTLNCENPDPACDLDVVPHHGREAKLDYVLNNSFGFGGINSCVVLGRVRD